MAPEVNNTNSARPRPLVNPAIRDSNARENEDALHAQSMIKSLTNRTVQLAFGSAIAILLVVGGFAYRSIVVLSESDRWVQHTHEVLENLEELQLAMETVSSSVRGYVLTEAEPYLEPYRASRLSLEQHAAAIRDLTGDNPEQQRQIPALERLAAERLERAEEDIKLRRARGMEAAAEAIRTGPDLRVTVEYRAIVRQMRDEEQRLLVLRNADAARNTSRTKTILILGTVLGLLITVSAGWSVHRDNSRRGIAEEALRESERKYRMLVQGVKDYAILMLGPRGEIRSWNPGAERMTGFTYEEVVGQNFSRFFPADDIKLGRPEEILRMAAASGQYEEQGLRVRRDNTRFLVRTTFSASRDPAGNLRGFSVISRDLTESRESEAKYRGLLEAAPDAMVVVNQVGEIVLLNLQAEKQFGYRRDELLGQKVTNIIPEGFAERLIADGLRSAEDALAQQIGTGIELVARRKNGSEFPIELMLSPLRSAEGTLVTAAIRDITARQTAAANLLQKVGELKRSNEELEQFASIASHDLQEPLRMVASYTQLLSRRYKGKLDSDADEFIAFAVDGASRMQRLIQDLLAYSRVGTRGSDLLDISSEDALRQALLNLRSAIEESGALVTHDPLPAVSADETQLIQLFQNLVGNAIKYQGPGIPKIHIAVARSSQKKWTFSVQDNGLGIEPQYFEKIFGMFQRLHKREAFAGTGIGLAICKKIVEQHGGRISVDSKPGHGSTFRFALAVSEGKS
jgi:PAS domain S-box-containing protein